MKKMLSLAAMFAALSYAAPASAALNIGGDASIRARNESYYGEVSTNRGKSDLKWQYRVRLNGAADLGDGFFFKTMITDENNAAGGWQGVGYGNLEKFTLNVSNFYFGRMQKDCHYLAGRIPLGSFNNPIFDLTLFPTQPLENPVANIVYDRAYGMNYGMKIGPGDANATLVMLDNNSTRDTAAEGDGTFNDGYALLLSYKFNIGDVTVEPQYLRILTNSDILKQQSATVANPFGASAIYGQVTPYTLGANVTVPAGKIKLGFSGMYTHCDDISSAASTGINAAMAAGYGGIPNAWTPAPAGTHVNYNGYELRIKGEVGNFMAFYDFNRTNDKTPGNITPGTAEGKYINHFVWAQYKIPVHQSAAGTVTIQPTLRYLANSATGGATGLNQQRLRTELWATVTF
jgi:hypothetical protein